MAEIVHFDADGTRVHVGFAGPAASAGVPSAPRLRDQLECLAVCCDQVVAGDLVQGVAEEVERGISTFHAGVVEHDRVDRLALSLIVVRRGVGPHADTAVGEEFVDHRAARLAHLMQHLGSSTKHEARLSNRRQGSGQASLAYPPGRVNPLCTEARPVSQGCHVGSVASSG